MRNANFPIMLGSTATGYYTPDLISDYWGAINETAPGTQEAAENAGWDWETILNNTTQFLQALVVTEQQRQIIKLNLERAKQGLPPVSATDVGMGVSVGLDDKTRMLLIMGGVALLGTVIYLATRRSR